ncbi:MAG: hypothetical protein K0Q74_371 [Gammaproteobacteria bacterium]|nr:hypothetical protein [Gammaproteobacteria bacterium]
MLKILFLMPALLALSACLGPVKTPTINTYTITAQQASTTKGTSHKGGVILVSMPVASPGLDTNQMVYIQKKHQLNYFAHNRWIAPPAEMLAPLLVQSIEETGCFAAVVLAPFVGNTEFNLQSGITLFQQIFEDDGSQVRVGLHVTLVDSTSEKVRQKWIEVTVPTQENTPYAGVVAMNEAVSSALRQVNRFVCSFK